MDNLLLAAPFFAPTEVLPPMPRTYTYTWTGNAFRTSLGSGRFASPQWSVTGRDDRVIPYQFLTNRSASPFRRIWFDINSTVNRGRSVGTIAILIAASAFSTRLRPTHLQLGVSDTLRVTVINNTRNLSYSFGLDITRTPFEGRLGVSPTTGSRSFTRSIRTGDSITLQVVFSTPAGTPDIPNFGTNSQRIYREGTTIAHGQVGGIGLHLATSDRVNPPSSFITGSGYGTGWNSFSVRKNPDLVLLVNRLRDTNLRSRVQIWISAVNRTKNVTVHAQVAPGLNGNQWWVGGGGDAVQALADVTEVGDMMAFQTTFGTI